MTTKLLERIVKIAPAATSASLSALVMAVVVAGTFGPSLMNCSFGSLLATNYVLALVPAATCAGFVVNRGLLSVWSATLPGSVSFAVVGIVAGLCALLVLAPGYFGMAPVVIGVLALYSLVFAVVAAAVFPLTIWLSGLAERRLGTLHPALLAAAGIAPFLTFALRDPAKSCHMIF